MTRWKMVPVELTPEMWENMHERASYDPHKIHKAMLAAAPEWEPSDEQVAVALTVYSSACRTSEHAMRATLKAAVGGG